MSTRFRFHLPTFDGIFLGLTGRGVCTGLREERRV